MNTKLIIVLCALTLCISPSFAQSKTTETSFKVFGNCTMCKERIETALDRPGIKLAEWNTQTKNLEVVFNNQKISEQEIHQLIASVGHDTDRIKAKDEVYAKLPFCCLYRNHDHSNIVDEPHDH